LTSQCVRSRVLCVQVATRLIKQIIAEHVNQLIDQFIKYHDTAGERHSGTRLNHQTSMMAV